MQGQVADRIVVPGAKVGRSLRVGEITEVISGHGGRRYRVHWSDGHDSIFSPGPDTTIDAEPRLEAEWDATTAARRARSAARQRGFVAGVGHEASIALSAARG